MLSHFRVNPRAFPRQGPLSPAERWLWVICWAVLVGRECLGPPVPFIGPDPADPYLPVPPVTYRSVVAPYASLRPALPRNWQQQNEEIAPKGEAPAHHH